MNFSDIFSKIRRKQSDPSETPSHWVKCPQCHSLMYYKEIQSCQKVCPKCSYHMRLDADERIEFLCDEFIEFDQDLEPNDPLKFVDKKSYKKRIQEANQKTKSFSAVKSGEAKIKDLSFQIVVFDFRFMGGSLGSVEGEKIIRAINRSIKNSQPLLIISASGGARMQESVFSLLQMSKTSAGLKKLSDQRIPYISLLTDPTMGGVSASFAWLGDIIMAEPNALIGFAGQRVIKQTIGEDLPEGFQKSEFLLEHGLIDMIVNRVDLKKTIYDLFNLLSVNSNNINSLSDEPKEDKSENIDNSVEVGKEI